MIYLIIYLYLLALVVFYDFHKKTLNRQAHKAFALLVLILVSGLRYRLGFDTVVYMEEFSQYPKLADLTMKSFADLRYQPLWIILNSFGQSLGGFVFVQLITSTIHILIIGYVMDRICPSLFFTSLLYYYLFDYYNFNFDVMREALSMSLILLALLKLEEKNRMGVIVYVLIATLFHIFALPVFLLFLLYYKFLVDRPYLGMTIVAVLVICGWLNANFVSESLLQVLVGGHDSSLENQVLTYANSEMFGLRNSTGIVSMVTFFMKGMFYIYGLYLLRPLYEKYVHFDWKIFSTTCWLSAILNFCFYSMPIFHRPYQYFTIFQSLLFILLFVYIAKRFVKSARAGIYILMIFLTTLLGVRKYMKPSGFAEGVSIYARFYPYSSVFDKTINEDRERSYIR